MKLKKMSKLSAVLLVLLVLMSMAFAVVLYTLTIPMQFRVSLAMGLELWNSDKTAKVTSITWSDFARDETKTQTFYIKNVGNKDANCTLSLGVYDTSAWLITDTFGEQLVLKDGFSSAFTISITEIDAISDGYYGCDLAFEIVDHFNVANEKHVVFEASTIAYTDDVTPYLEFVSESFDKPVYNLSEPVSYTFTTKNPNPDYILQAYSYQIDLMNESGFLSQIFNGMSGSMLGLEQNETNTITHVFNAPNVNGSYYLKLTYTGHNSEEIPEPIILTWICEGIAQANCHIDTVSVGSTQPNTLTTVYFDFWHEIGVNVQQIEVNVKIWNSDKTVLISQPYINYWIEVYVQRDIRVHLSLTFTTPNPSTSQTYVIQVIEFNIQT